MTDIDNEIPDGTAPEVSEETQEIVVPAGTRIKPEPGVAYITTVDVVTQGKSIEIKTQKNRHKLAYCQNRACLKDQKAQNKGRVVGMRAAEGAFKSFPLPTCSACGTQWTWHDEGVGVNPETSPLPPVPPVES